MKLTTETKCLNAESIGAVIRKRRKQLGYTQEEVAPIVNLSPRLIGEIERGRDTVGIGKVMRLCNILGLDFYLLARE